MPANIITARNIAAKLTAATTFTVPGDASAVSGEKVVRILTTYGESTHTWPAGWTKIFDANQGDDATSQSNRMSIAEFLATGAVADASVSTNAGAAIEAGYGGFSLEDHGVIVVGVGEANPASADPFTNAVTANGVGDENLYIAISAWGRGVRTLDTAPLPDNQTDYSGGANNNPSLAFCSDLITADSLASQIFELNFPSPHVSTLLAVSPVPPPASTIITHERIARYPFN